MAPIRLRSIIHFGLLTFSSSLKLLWKKKNGSSVVGDNLSVKDFLFLSETKFWFVSFISDFHKNLSIFFNLESRFVLAGVDNNIDVDNTDYRDQNTDSDVDSVFKNELREAPRVKK